MSTETSWRKPSVTGGLGTFGIFVLVAVISALKANFHDRLWVTAYFTAVAIALAGTGVLVWERWSASDSVVCRRCGQTLLLLGIVGLLVLSFFALSHTSV
jgi:hypothetical protein